MPPETPHWIFPPTGNHYFYRASTARNTEDPPKIDPNWFVVGPGFFLEGPGSPRNR